MNRFVPNTGQLGVLRTLVPEKSGHRVALRSEEIAKRVGLDRDEAANDCRRLFDAGLLEPYAGIVPSERLYVLTPMGEKFMRLGSEGVYALSLS